MKNIPNTNQYIQIFNSLFQMNLGHAKIVDIIAGPRVFNTVVKLGSGAKISSLTKTANAAGVLCRPMKNSANLVFEFGYDDAKPITLKTLLKNDVRKGAKATLPVILGVDTFGVPQIVDLTKLPHLLVSGRTGSGKTMFLESITKTLANCKFTVFDPKGVDFKSQKNINVITDATEAFNELDQIIADMDKKYASKEKNIKQYHIIIFDEFADFVALDRKRFENTILALAQKGRKCGIHLIMATQRPDAIINTLRANLPVRLVFQTRSKADSVKALGEPGAELLLGWADALYSDAGRAPVRIHTPIM